MQIYHDDCFFFRGIQYVQFALIAVVFLLNQSVFKREHFTSTPPPTDKKKQTASDHQLQKRESHVLIVRLSPPCAGEERGSQPARQPACVNPRGGDGRLYSPLSRGLREFTESRPPLAPRRGRACCSSFAVAPPLLIHPPASLESPRNSKRSTGDKGCEAILGSRKKETERREVAWPQEEQG